MKLGRFVTGVGIVVFAACAASNARASTPIAIELELVVDGLAAPVQVTHAGDGSGRLFIVDQAGLIRVLENGVLLPAPFLDVTAKLPALGAVFDERGLLGLAFHPDYPNNGRFFVRYSAPRVGAPDEPCTTSGFNPGCHAEVLAEYQVSVGDPNLADPTSEVILFSVDEPQFNHNAGAVAFGPDGFLYFSLGDGGGANDGLNEASLPHGPIGNGQNIDTFLGTLLRIDVDSPPGPGLSYAIPLDNPFVGGPGLDEIYAYGFRNPYQFSFDDGPGGDGSIYLADVGQNLFEEVDIVAKGGNYGWVIREGFHCFDPFNPTVPPAVCPAVGTMLGDPLLDPVNEYLHPVPCLVDADCAPLGVSCGGNGLCENEGGISVIGGYIYRGSANPALLGRYVFGDFSAAFFVATGRLYWFDIAGPDAYLRNEFCIAPDGNPLGKFLKGFGEDEDGEVYVAVSDALAPFGDTGSVLRITNASTDDCDGNGVPDACEEDSDGDGTIDACDGCPTDPNKTVPGVCGCNVPDTDRDHDGTPNCIDGCPDDPGKIEPGVCGCGVSDSADADGDTVPDCNDVCSGADDAVFAPECADAIPAASQWGLAVMTLLLLTAAKLYFGRSIKDRCRTR